MRVLLGVVVLFAQQAAAQLTFGFHAGSVYTFKGLLRHEDRAERSTVGLLRFAAAQPPQGTVVATIHGGIDSDHPGEGELAFSRSKGDNETVLWPSEDTWGWPAVGVPPHDLLLKVFEEEMPDWPDRANTAYWGGVSGSVRELRCMPLRSSLTRLHAVGKRASAVYRLRARPSEPPQRESA